MATWNDVIVIGAGAAGMMSAIAAAQGGAHVLLLEANPERRSGAKILVSGGGRCNVTNEDVVPARFNGGSAQFISRILRSFSQQDTLRFFARIGVELKLEETGKFFPVSNSAKTVLAALKRALVEVGVTTQYDTDVTAVKSVDGGFALATSQGQLLARTIILCTGGKALPKSGSDGRGYGFAIHFGHTLVPTTPALTPLLAQPLPHAELSGITLPVRLKLATGKRTLALYTGSFLFTHTGYSGPVALNISRHVVRQRWQFPEAAVTMRLFPWVEEGQEGQWWQEFQREVARKTAFNAVNEHLPGRVTQSVLRSARLPEHTSMGRLSGEQAKALRTALLDMPLPVEEVADYVKAETTAGGISLEEMEPASMMSKLVPGLFFAGEVCDVDGWLGGYNFQWAWSSGTVAGRGAVRFLKRQQEAGKRTE